MSSVRPRRTWKPTAESDLTASEAWQAQGRDSGPMHHRGRGYLRLAAVVLVFAGFLALLIYVAFWLSPARGTAVVLISTGYEDNLALPHNVYGRQGLDGLGQFITNRGRAAGLRLQHTTSKLIDVNDWDRGLANIAEKNIVVFLSLHGDADRKGGVLLPQKAGMPVEPDSLDADTTQLRLETILDRLAKLPPNRNIILILDATQPAAAWHVGMVHNAFARALDALDDRIRGMSNLVVMSASDIEQRSWVAEELHRSIFTHFLTRGLEGAADQNGDGRIDGLELHHYVAKNVERWTGLNRGALQTPVLYPRGPDGEARAQRIHLSVVPGPVPAQEAGTAFEGSPELTAAWKQCQALAQQQPQPAVYTPALWREYQDTLLRYEQLVAAGEKEVSAQLAARLKSLAQEIASQKALPLTFSLQNTLALPRAAGYTLPDAPLAKLVDAKDQKDAWAKMRKTLNPGGDPVAESLLRVRLLEQVVQQTADNPAPALDASAQLVKLLDAPDDIRPAEAHYLVMLQHSLQQLEALGLKNVKKPLTLAPADVQLALHVRLQAERAALGIAGDKGKAAGHPYSEYVQAWLEAAVSKADEKRRFGEDLLFASDAKQLQDGRDHLHQAQAAYTAIFAAQGDTIAAVPLVREALELRDTVVPVLPYYARWVAGHEGADSAGQPEEQALLTRMLDLCRHTHDLIRLLDEGPFVVAQGDKTAIQSHLAKLNQTRSNVNAAFTTVDKKFRQTLKNVELVSDARHWHELDNLLAVPFAEPAARQELLHKRGQVAVQLIQQANDPSRQAPRITPAENAAESRKQATEQAQLALAVLGEKYFDDNNDGKHESWDRVLGTLKSFANQGRWQDIIPVGQEIGWRWQQLPRVIANLTQKDYKAAPAQMLVNLQRADRLTRFLDGAGQEFLNRPPAADFRHLLAQHLLLWQTQRAYLDHWFGESKGNIYFQRAGNAYLKDAGKWLPNPLVAALSDEIKQAGALQLKLWSAPGVPADSMPAGATLHLTTERDFPLKYRLQPANKSALPPSGYPVVWMKPGPLLQPTDPGELKRQMAFISPTTTTVIGASFVNPLLGQKEKSNKVVETEFAAYSLFRGQLVEQTTPIVMHPRAQIVKLVPPLPKFASVAVRSSKAVQEIYGSSQGHIAIVLDCSGSMRAAKGQTASKFAEATQTLLQVMQTIPKGTTVSLWIFGEAMGPEKTVKEAEKTIRRLLPPMTWNPEKPAQLQFLAQEIGALEPWNESPIVRTMLHARNDLIKAPGFKSLVVITDGMDNRIHNDPEFNPGKKDIPTLLVENFQGIQVNIIGFKIASAEQAQAQAQFASVEKFGLGKFFDIRDKIALELTLKTALRQKLHYWIDRLDSAMVAGFPEQGLSVSQTGADETWVPGGLAPGNFSVRVQTNKMINKAIALNPSDLLLLELSPLHNLGGPNGALAFHRVLFAEEGHPGAALKATEKTHWLMGLLQNEIKPSGAQMLVTLERQADSEDGILQQIKPRDVWFEVDAPGGVSDVYERFYYQPGYPASTWGIDLPDWPKQKVPGSAVAGTALAKPVVHGWFSPYQPAHGLLLERGHAFANPLDVQNKRIATGNQEIVIDSILLEPHAVETRAPKPDQLLRPTEPRMCLVVRITYAPSNPVWVRLHGLPLGGEEHHFFTKANKYTGIFWPVTADQAKQVLDAIEVISLADFKRQATEFNYDITLDHLPAPSAASKRPQSPVDVFALPDGGGSGVSAVPLIPVDDTATKKVEPAPENPTPELPSPKPVAPSGPPSAAPSPILGPGQPIEVKATPQLPYPQPVLPTPALKPLIP